MTRITGRQALSANGADREEKVKQRIFEKVAKRMKELRVGSAVCAELNPDVIVIAEDQSFLFEAQNVRAAQWLCCHLGLHSLRVRERVRVHPARCEGMANELKTAGFAVC